LIVFLDDVRHFDLTVMALVTSRSISRQVSSKMGDLQDVSVASHCSCFVKWPLVCVCVCVLQSTADATSVNISLCLLVTYFTCYHGDDVTSTNSDGVTRQPSEELSPWQQPVMQFVAKTLRSSRRDTRYLQQMFSLISRLFTMNISTGMCLTREHWIRRITFAAETNATDTHSVTLCITIPSLAKQQRRCSILLPSPLVSERRRYCVARRPCVALYVSPH